MTENPSPSPTQSRRGLRFVLGALLVLALSAAGFWSGSKTGYKLGYAEGPNNEPPKPGALSERIYEVADLVFRVDADRSKVPADYDSITELITTVVDPLSWDDIGGRGTIVPTPNRHALTIKQTDDVHARIADLLKQIRARPGSS